MVDERAKPASEQDPDPDRLQALVVECLERLEREGEAAVDAVCASHPEHAAAIRRRLAGLRAVGLLGADDARGFPERLGDFRLIERLGAGGMGVVFLAEQTSLGREVALKLIRPEQLYFGRARERFAREVETVARLQHPGIVPVYTVGVEGGSPYFAMERVRGCTLEDVRAELAGREPVGLSGADLAAAVQRRTGAGDGAPAAGWLFEGSWEDACLRVARLVAEALEHAHRHGVLHRDIKPSNVMLTPGGRVMLLDFGLASTADAATLTRTGSQLGSLPYMSPEQLSGGHERLGPQCDVYSLGVTLYELLALRPAFARSSTPALVAAIERGEAAPLRQLNPAVSWEAETVCAAAMDADPARRYARAADLARDLDNVLQRRPIEARRAGWLRRARRWAQRRPAAALAIALGALIVVVGPTVFGVQQRGAARRIEEQKDRALAAQAQAEANLHTALDAVDRLLSEVGGVELRDAPQMEGVRRRLLEDAVRFLDALLAQGPDDPELLAGALESYLRLAAVQEQVGEPRAALATLDAVQPRLEQLAQERGGVELHELRASAWRERGEALSALGDEAAARATHERAVAIAEDLLRAQPSAARRHGFLADHLDGLARCCDRMGERALAEQHLATAGEHLSAVLAEDARDADALRLRVRIGKQLGDIYEDTERPGPSEDAYRAALAAGAELERAGPATRELRSLLAVLHQNLSILLGPQGRHEECAALLDEARRRHEELARDFPETPFHGIAAARILINLGTHRYRTGDAAGALVHMEQAEERLLALDARFPGDVEIVNLRCIAAQNAGTYLWQEQRTDEGTASIRAAVDLARACVAASPDRPELQEQLCRVVRYLRSAYLKRYEEHTEQIVALSLELLERCPGGWEDYQAAAFNLARAAGLATDEAGAEAAERYVQQAAEVLVRAEAAGHAQSTRAFLDDPAVAELLGAPFAELRRRMDAQD